MTLVLYNKSVCLYLRWWEEIRCSHLQEPKSLMGQLWCEHITERKPSEKNSVARAEELSKSTAMCSLPRTIM